MSSVLRAALVLAGLVSAATAADRAEPLGDAVMEPPTIVCLGMRWIVRGDDNANASIAVAWRVHGAKDAEWKPALPMHRVLKGKHRATGRETNPSALTIPDDAWLFAGSLIGLEPATAYEVRLTLRDPDGGEAEQVLSATTRAEPTLAPGGVLLHVVPGDGGGSGSEADPFRGFAAAQAAASPGARFRVHAGTYPGTVVFTASGEPGNPVAWLGPEDGEAIIDGGHRDRAAAATDIHDVWFGGLVFQAADFGFVAHGSDRLVITNCRFRDIGYGLTAHDHGEKAASGFFIADNEIVGRIPWILPFEGNAEADAAWHDETRGIEIAGVGHVVTRNAVHHIKDGIDLCGAHGGTCDCDIYRNLLTECIDDGIELDYSERNNRAFENRIVNTHTGISIQPVFGGPDYAVRNLLVNVHGENLKIHNCPSGVLFLHNTCVHHGAPFDVETPDRSTDIVFRDNLFVGTGGRALNYDEPAEALDLDYDGFAGWSGDVLLKVYDVRYATSDDVRATAPIERHHALVDARTLFASGVAAPADAKEAMPHDVDLRLREGSAAIDAGERLPGIDDGFAGKAPDLGAIEYGSDAPAVGPRAVETKSQK